MKRAFLVGIIAAAFAALAVAGFTATAAVKSAGTPGAIVVDTAQESVEITKVDMAKRSVSLKMPSGRVRTFKVGKDYDLKMLKKGDIVTATVIEALAVYVEKAGGRPSASETSTVWLSPKGGTSRMVMANTVRITGKVESVDAHTRSITVMGPMGQSRTFKVGANVKNLDKLKAGDSIVLRYTEALALDLRKPMK